MSKYITDNVEIPSDEKNSDKWNFDRENSNEETYSKE